MLNYIHYSHARDVVKKLTKAMASITGGTGPGYELENQKKTYAGNEMIEILRDKYEFSPMESAVLLFALGSNILDGLEEATADYLASLGIDFMGEK
jgi:hypothetical protein